ncbi:MAG TPA: hypothetical protein VGK74_08675 [Symbiobacteriaceae bacterium]
MSANSQGATVLRADAITPTLEEPQGFTVVLWIMLILGAIVVVWLGLKAIQTENVSTRLAATFAGLILLALKIGIPLEFGPPEQTPMEKCKSLGADLAFASISFDITMYLGNARIADLGPIKVTNPGWFYIVVGVITLLVWLFGLYNFTGRKSKPSNLAISVSMVFGVIFYFGKILLYVLRG